ncbi:MAG: hypothetical protein F6K31_29720 [Symploca sp. SIO2G7]|nr:hypothetical protein [Symploca sp. SIO2G7]
MEFDRPKNPIYGKTQGEKKNGNSSSQCFPNSPSPRHRVTASPRHRVS